jgi:hypothetical protein
MRVVLALMCAAGLGGCFAGTLEPWFPTDGRLDVSAAVGPWQEVDGDVRLEILPVEGGALTVVATGKDGAPARFSVHAAAREHGNYVDVQLDEDDEAVHPLQACLVRPHFLLRAAVEGDTLKVWLVQKTGFVDVLRQEGVPVFPPIDSDDDGPRLILADAEGRARLLQRLDQADVEALWGAPLLFARVDGHVAALP